MAELERRCCCTSTPTASHLGWFDKDEKEDRSIWIIPTVETQRGVQQFFAKKA
jgi:hypothetical protein